MPVLLLIVAWILTALLLCDLAGGWRATVLAASAALGTVVVAMTELLSLFESLTLLWVAACWAVVCAALFAAYAWRRGRGRTVLPRRAHARPLEWSLRILLIGTAVICILTGLTAMLSPPNNWDSMTYHMARVVHWIQAGTVAHYPTHLVSQVYSNPGAEFIVAHLQILAGGDWAANLVQWFAFLGCIIGASAIAESLGTRRRGQIYAAAVAATVPMAILQASSTQVDMVTSFWLVAFTYFSLRLMRPVLQQERARLWLNACAAGASLGLALLTKGTVWAFACPVALWLLANLVFMNAPGRARRCATSIALIAVLVLCLNAGHLARNAHYGSAVRGGPDMARTWNASLTSPEALVSNLLRNASLEVPYTGGFVRVAHTRLGLDVSDPRTTLAGSGFTPPGLSNNEDSAGNPIHFVLLLLASVAVLVVPGLRKRRVLLLYLMVLISGTLLFCLLFRWQPWGSRLLLPLSVLSAPLIAVVLDAVDPAVLSRFAQRWKWALVAALLSCGAILAAAFVQWWQRFAASDAKAFALAAFVSVLLALLLVLFLLVARRAAGMDWMTVFCMVLLLSAFPYALVNSSRPLIGHGNVFTTARTALAFANRPEMLGPYVSAAEYIKRSGVRDVGLILGGDTWEYPLWVLLDDDAGGVPRIENVDVTNSTGTTAVPSKCFAPGLVLVVGLDKGESFSDSCGDYVRVADFGVQTGTPVVLYRRVGDDTHGERGWGWLSEVSIGAARAYPSAAPAFVIMRVVSGVTMYGVLSSLITLNDAASSQ